MELRTKNKRFIWEKGIKKPRSRRGFLFALALTMPMLLWLDPQSR